MIWLVIHKVVIFSRYVLTNIFPIGLYFHVHYFLFQKVENQNKKVILAIFFNRQKIIYFNIEDRRILLHPIPAKKRWILMFLYRNNVFQASIYYTFLDI